METNHAFIPHFDAVVLANGDYPTAELPLQLLRNAHFVACCDGAANAYIAQGNLPNMIVGDGDSIHDIHHQEWGHLFHHIGEQESNDLTKTIRLLAEMGKRRIAVLGATGKREDHTLGNISLLIDYMHQGWDVSMYTDHGRFLPCHDTTIIPAKRGQQISIFNFGAHHFSAEGLVYPLYDFTQWWQGTLNECQHDQVVIHAQGDYLVYLAYR